VSQRRLLAFFVFYIAAAMLAAVTAESSVFFGDLPFYERRLDPILDGHLPYFDATFEHFPLSLATLLGAHGLSLIPGLTFNTGFIVISGVLLVFVLRTLERLDGPAATRWLIMTVPLFPIILFRLDPIALAMSAAALLYLDRDDRVRTWVTTMLGVAARAWPVVLAAAMWRKSWKAAAVSAVVITGLLSVGLVLTPGFSEGRSFSGIHLETVTGSLLATFRHVTGADPQIASAAGARYVAGPNWIVITNAFIGLAATGPFLWSTRRAAVPVQLSLLTYCLLLVSPLLSAQFLSWPLVFLALVATAPVAVVAATGLLTSATLLLWAPSSGWWIGLVALRNLVLLATPWLIARRVLGDGNEGQPSISRRNLPV
jgi:hypothetical protein